MSNCHSLKVVGRGSGTQLQVIENLNYLIWRFRDYYKRNYYCYLQHSPPSLQVLECPACTHCLSTSSHTSVPGQLCSMAAPSVHSM